MGLDMYLYDENDEQVGYWRKANSIHRWFVDQVQGGRDDCGSYPVSREKLGELLGLVEQVLADKSLGKKLLPTYPGFFFGQYDYNDWYQQDMEDTRKILIDVLKREGKTFTYGSSW